MKYENERRIKLYTRKTKEFLEIGWEGRLVLFHIYCEANVIGRIEVPAGEDLLEFSKKLALPEELVGVGLPRLLRDDAVRWEPADTTPGEPVRQNIRIGYEAGEYVIVDFAEREKAKRSGSLRSAEYKEKRRLLKELTERERQRRGAAKKGPSHEISTAEARALGLLNRAAAARELGVSIPTLRRRHEGQSLPIYRSELGEYLFRPSDVHAVALTLREASAAHANREPPAERGDSPIWRERAARLAEAMGSKSYTGAEMAALAKKIGMKDHLIGHVLAAAEGEELVKTNGKWTAAKGEK